MQRVLVVTEDSPEVKQKLVCGLCGCPFYPGDKIIITEAGVAHFACDQCSEGANN